MLAPRWGRSLQPVSRNAFVGGTRERPSARFDLAAKRLKEIGR